MTHYVLAFTVQRRQLFLTACGEFVSMTKHTNEPECPACKAWLEKDAVDGAETAEALEVEFQEFKGKLVTPDDRHHL